MSVAVYCGDCDERVWPPADREGPGGQTEIAARDLALDHVRKTGHTDVSVTPGCYYVGDGERPTAFGDGTATPSEVVSPSRGQLAGNVAAAARTLREIAESVEEWEDPEFAARHLEQYATAIESPLTYSAEAVAGAGAWPEFSCPRCRQSVWVSGFDDATTVAGQEDGYREVAHCGVCEFVVIRRV